MQRIFLISISFINIFFAAYQVLHATGARIYIERYGYQLTPKKGVKEIVVTFQRVGGYGVDRNVYQLDKKGTITKEIIYLYNSHSMTITYLYDERNNVIETKSEWPNSSNTEILRSKYVYDNNGNILEETAIHGDGRFAWHNKYTYDKNNNKITFEHTNYAGAKSITKYLYNNNGKLVEEYDNDSKQTSYQYDQQGRMTLKFCHTYDKKFSYHYDKLGRLKEIRDMDHKGFVFYRYVFDYNKDGDIIKISSRFKETDAGKTLSGIADYATIEYKGTFQN
ncbi:MAG: RHS repeat protein [Spirochaetes bacterium]|nr:RHS repeat protein [Spirochaetota bacterium]